MRKSAKIVTALSVAGLAVAAGSAFTGTGLTNNAGESQFVGGTVSQAVSGATLTNVGYGFYDTDTQNEINSIALTFAAGAEGKAVTVTTTGGSGGTFTCEAIGAATANVSNCTFTATATESGYTGLTSLAVSVANPA
ncbi:hypothetical protein ACFWIX_02105 [Pseudarthrobacter sp. NPDC058362]|uniref:hypothetical protein n=1 Tax=unclassified Pseudarthrobacter TaxID=2647000 RepID=UPI00365C636D